MGKKFSFILVSSAVFTMVCSPIILERVASANTNTRMTESIKVTSNSGKVVNSFLSNSLLKWEPHNFGKGIIKDINHINTFNNQMRWKYFNKSDYYNPHEYIEEIDSQFNSASISDMVLYGNLNTLDLGISRKYFIDNTEKVFESMIKDTIYGKDNGYFLGNISEQPLDQQKGEYIRVKLNVPKGTPLMKVGDEVDSNYILPRDTVLKYIEKSFDKNTKTITITAEIVDQDELDKTISEKQVEINDKLKQIYGTPSDFIKLNPLGFNAGYVLNTTFDAVAKAIESLNTGGIYSKNFFDKQRIEISNAWFGNTDLFEEEYKNLSLEKRRDIFLDEYDPGTNGETLNYKSPIINTIITLSHFENTDSLPQLKSTENITATILHESFHYLTLSTKEFVNLPLYSKNPNGFKDEVEKLMPEEEDAIEKLLNDDYVKDDYEEYTSEAFMAKWHPLKEISDDFKKVAPKTNRLLDKLFDVTPPSTPKNLTATEISGNNIKFIFDHSTDNTGVKKYNIYLDGKLVESVDTIRDGNGLSYPNPKDHQDKIEVTIDNLEQITNYQLQVTAVDDTENESAKSKILKITTKDIEPPQQTGPLRGAPLKSDVAQFFWSKPKDNKKVDKVKLYRNETLSKDSDQLLFSRQTEQVITVSGNENSYTDVSIEKGKTYTYYMVALDEAGNVSEKSNIVTIKSSDQDDENKNEDMAENTTYTNSVLNWGDTFEGLSPSGFNIFSWFSDGLNWLSNGVTAITGNLTSSLVDLKPETSNQFVVVPVDSEGNPLGDGLPISVISVNNSSIKVKDTTIYTKEPWNPEDNFVSATDENGDGLSLDDSRIMVTGKVDTNTPGDYTIKYTFKGIVKDINVTCNVTVKETVPIEIFDEPFFRATSLFTEVYGPSSYVNWDDSQGGNVILRYDAQTQKSAIETKIPISISKEKRYIIDTSASGGIAIISDAKTGQVYHTLQFKPGKDTKELKFDNNCEIKIRLTSDSEGDVKFFDLKLSVTG